MSRVIDGAPPSNASAAPAGLRPRRQSSRRSNGSLSDNYNRSDNGTEWAEIESRLFLPTFCFVGITPFNRNQTLILPACRSVVGAARGPVVSVAHRTNAKTRLRTAKRERIM